MDYTKGERVRVINEKLAQSVTAMVSNEDTGTVIRNYNDGFVRVEWDTIRYPNWDIQIEALASVTPELKYSEEAFTLMYEALKRWEYMAEHAGFFTPPDLLAATKKALSAAEVK